MLQWNIVVKVANHLRSWNRVKKIQIKMTISTSFVLVVFAFSYMKNAVGQSGELLIDQTLPPFCKGRR